MTDQRLSELPPITDPGVSDTIYVTKSGTSHSTLVQHLLGNSTQTGEGPPLTTPEFVGQAYHDTLNKRVYFAADVLAPTDFQLVGSSSDGVVSVTASGAGISRGDVVAGTTESLILADSDSEATSQVIGIANEAIAGGAGEIIISGLITDVDTTNFAPGAILYVGAEPGTLTDVVPTSGFVAEVGTCMVQNGTTGSILVNPKIYGSASITQSLWVHAQALTAASTNGGTAGTLDYATGGQTRSVMTFAAGQDEAAFVDVKLPNGWDRGAVTFTPHWSHAAGGTAFNCVWSLQAISFGDGEPIDALFGGTPVTVTDTGAAEETQYIGDESGLLTVDNTPGSGDMVTLRISRLGTNPSDTLDVAAHLHGFDLRWVRNQMDDV